MTASEAREAATAAENAWYASYAQDALDCRAAGFEPATSQQTRDLRIARSSLHCSCAMLSGKR
jgi:hypothetical protein